MSKHMNTFGATTTSLRSLSQCLTTFSVTSQWLYSLHAERDFHFEAITVLNQYISIHLLTALLLGMPRGHSSADNLNEDIFLTTLAIRFLMTLAMLPQCGKENQVSTLQKKHSCSIGKHQDRSDTATTNIIVYDSTNTCIAQNHRIVHMKRSPEITISNSLLKQVPSSSLHR